MRAGEILEKIMKEKKIKKTEVARRLGRSYRTIYNTLINDRESSNGGMKFENVVEFANAIGCDVVFVDRETGNVYYQCDRREKMKYYVTINIAGLMSEEDSFDTLEEAMEERRRRDEKSTKEGHEPGFWIVVDENGDEIK